MSRVSNTIVLSLVGAAALIGSLSLRSTEEHAAALQIHFQEEDFLEAQWLTINQDDFVATLQRLGRGVSAVARLLADPLPSPTTTADLRSSPRDLAAYVWGRTPAVITVYPSEDYYYFSIPSNGHLPEIRGNFRFAYLPQGEVSFGFYFSEDGALFAKGEYLSTADELRVFNLARGLWRVRLFGVDRVVILPSQRDYASSIESDEPNLTRDEQVSFTRVIDRLIDESGVGFTLWFGDERNNFFYSLLEDESQLERQQIPGLSAWMDKRTGLVFTPIAIGSTTVQVLIGVSRSNSETNSYFDGPFDQVHARGLLRSLLFKAYPYSQMIGLDPFGNMCGVIGSRMAIAPYLLYSTLEEFKVLFEHCNREATTESERLQCVTFDEKQYFHRSSPVFTHNGELVTGSPRTCQFSHARSRANEARLGRRNAHAMVERNAEEQPDKIHADLERSKNSVTSITGKYG